MWSLQVGQSRCDKATQKRAQSEKALFQYRYPQWSLKRISETSLPAAWRIRPHSHPLYWWWKESHRLCPWMCFKTPWKAIYMHVPIYNSRSWIKVQDRKANVVYKKEVSSMQCDPALIGVQTPRNMKQPRNLRFKHLQQSWISQDAPYCMHELAYNISGFIWKITTFPDLVCICGLQKLLEELDRVLLLDPHSQLLSYDTRFQLGDFMFPHSFSVTLFSKTCPVFQQCSCFTKESLLTHTESYSKSVWSKFQHWKRRSVPL